MSILHPYVLGGALLAAVVLAGSGYLKGRADGRALAQAAIAAKINQENANAGNHAEKWRADFRRCIGAGGMYDFEAGTCDR